MKWRDAWRTRSSPLTPIALSAERIARQLERADLPPATAQIVQECAATIVRSVESVKTLVDEFSQFARFPAAQPVRCDLNGVVADALAVFHGRQRASRSAPVSARVANRSASIANSSSAWW